MEPVTSFVPRPSQLETVDGTFALTPATSISTPPALLQPALRLQEALRRPTGFALPVEVGTVARDDGSAPTIRFELDPLLDVEAYRLDITPTGVQIAAATERGAQWAGQTFLQALPPAVYRHAPVADVTWAAAAASVVDAPRFAWRGLMLDVARHFLPPREILRLLDLMAMHRLNTLHLHLTDDQGWRLEIRRYPRLAEVGGWRPESQVGAGTTATRDGRPHGGYYTQDDIREIIAYAAARGILVVPEIELPGHTQAAIAAYPELGLPGAPSTPWTEWGINPTVINAAESTIEFFEHVFDEVIELFDSPYIGVGGDECPKEQWQEDAGTQARMRELGLADEEALQSWIITRMDKHLTAAGRRLLGWDEILEGGLAAGATVLSWRGWTGAINAARAGHDVISCPEDTVYLDYRQSDSPDEPIPVATVTTVADAYTFDPVPAALTEAEATHVLGGQANLWTEHVDSPRTLDYLLFPRLAAIAEALWTAGPRDYAEFVPRLTTHLARLDAAGVEYRRADGPRPWQRRPGVPGRPETREAAAAHLAAITANIA